MISDDATSPEPIRGPDRKRVIWISLSLFTLFAMLIAQFFRIQIIEGERWSRAAKGQHFFIVKEPGLRGTFISNASVKKGHPEIAQRLVIDVEKFHLYIDPESIPDKNKGFVSNHLIGMLDLSVAEQMGFRKHFYRKSRSRKLAMWLERESRDAVLAWWLPYARKHKIARNALFFMSDYQRSYPFGKLLGQVLHTIQNNKDEATQQAIPTGGLELQFNNYLKGKQGKRRLMRSPRNSFETGEVIAPPEHGANIYLTINHCLQAIAEEEVAKGVKKCKAKAGWAVMMDPRSGEILALAQYPFFYPPDYQHYFNDTKMIEHTRVKAVTDANEPGSIMKPVTLAVALLANEALRKKGEKELFSPTQKMETLNGRFPGRSKLITDTHPSHFLNMEMALQKSSNIYVARLVESIIVRLGKEWYRQVLHETFGVGKKTGIELPAESNGVLPKPGKKHPNGTFEWSTPTPFSMAFGHNLQMSSMQLMRTYALFANGGYLVQPTLLRKIVKPGLDSSQEVLLDYTGQERQKAAPRVLSADIVKAIVLAMKYVTKPGGTASKAEIWGYTEAGKTSTAKKIVNGAYSETLYVATFVGFTPVSNPAFVLLVCMDEPEYGYVPGLGKVHNGGNCTALVFREIATRSLAYLGVAPDDPHGYPRSDPRYDKDKADWMPEIRKLNELYEAWNHPK